MTDQEIIEELDKLLFVEIIELFKERARLYELMLERYGKLPEQDLN